MKRFLIGILYNDPKYDKRESVLDLRSETSVLDEVKAVEKALNKLKIKCVRIAMNGDVSKFVKDVQKSKVGVIFNLCESVNGNNMLEMNIPAVLELLNISYTGSPPITLGLAVDKGKVKEILNRNGIPTPEYKVFKTGREKWDNGFPAIVKPLHEDASLGITKDSVVKDESSLIKQVEYVQTKFKQPAIVERFIDGREFNVAILGEGENLEVLPVSEIDFSTLPKEFPAIVSYEAKWEEDSIMCKATIPVCPAKIDKETEERIVELAKKSYNVVGCRDYGRVDMRLEKDTNKLYVLEVNPNPDISTDAGLARSTKAKGMSYEDLINKIISFAVKRKK